MITHLHHILPTHAGGSDDPSNLIRLTIPEHAEAHRKLFEEHGRREDWLAWQALNGMLGKEEIIREAMLIGAKKGGKIGGQRGGRAGKGKKKPAGFGAIVSANVSGSKNGMYGVVYSREERLARSVAVKRAIKDGGGNTEWQGTKNLLESYQRRKAAGAHPSQIDWCCEHCGIKSRGIGNYHRHHGKNCKKLNAQQSSLKATDVANWLACNA